MLHPVPIVITEPSREPVTLQEVYEHLRITESSEDAMLRLYIAAARKYFEARTGRTIHETQYEVALEYWPGSHMVLPRATPLISVVSVKYVDSAGVETTVATTEYVVDTWLVPGSLKLGYNKSWPTFTAYPASPIRIRYRAGLASSPEVDAPQDIQLPILLLVGGMYENRESEVISNMAMLQDISLRYGAEAFIQMNTVDYAF